MTDGFSATTQLIHHMGELWVRHMHQAAAESDIHEKAEINEEIADLSQLLEASKIELETHAKTDASAPMSIILAYLNENEPHAAPFAISVVTQRPINYLIKSACAITLDAGQWLDDNYPQMICLEWQPQGRNVLIDAELKIAQESRPR